MIYRTIITAMLVLSLTGCLNVPSSDELKSDIQNINKNIELAQKDEQVYSGGLIKSLITVRLETLKSTKAMLEQKDNGLSRFIPVSYTIDGTQYSAPKNKKAILTALTSDLNDLKKQLSKAEKISSNYRGGMLKVLALTQVETLKNSISFLQLKQLLLKYDIPFYAALPKDEKIDKFQSTPGKDIDKF